MSTYTALARALAALAARSPADQPEGDLAYLGFKPVGGAYAIKVNGRPNWVWVRLEHGRDRAPVQAFNAAQVRRIPDCPVRVKLVNGLLHVVGYDVSSMASFLGNTPLDSTEPGLGSIEPVSTRRIKSGLLHCYKVGGSYGLSIYVEPFAYHYNGQDLYWAGGALDVSGYVTTTAGTQNWIKVGHNPATNALGAVAGTAKSQLVALTRADLDALSLAGYIPLGGVKVKQGQTAIDDERTLADCRPWWMGMGTPLDLIRHNLAASAAPTTGDDSGDGYGVGSEWVDTAADKAYKCVDASVGAAVWSEIAAGSGSGFRYALQPQDAAVNAVTLSTWAYGSNGWKLPILAYDPDTEGGANWTVPLPGNLPSSFTATLTLHWSTPGSSGAVRWRALTLPCGDGETLDAAGSAAFATDSVIAALDNHVVSLTLDITGWGANNLLLLRVTRIAGDASDTLTSEAYLLNAHLELTW